MLLIDANVILRYILSDNDDMAKKATELFEKSKVTVRYEVIAEVVYVLHKVYLVPRAEVSNNIRAFCQLPNVEIEHNDVLTVALDAFAGKNIDFVDSVLYGFADIYDYDVFSFDKKLNSLIGGK